VLFCTAGYFVGPHGELFDRRGLYIDGPSPRGMDRFKVRVTNGAIEVNVGDQVEGPPRDVPGIFPARSVRCPSEEWVEIRPGFLADPRQGPEPLTEAPPGATPSPKIQEVFDIEPFPWGTEPIGVQGRPLARAVEGEQHWTLSVTRQGDILCLHLNSGEGCGWPTAPGVPRDPIGVFGAGVEGPEGRRMSFVYGPAEKRVAEVAISFTNGTTLRATVIEGPPKYEANFYIVGVRGTARPTIVRALDRRGAVLGTVVVHRPERSGPEAGEKA
jgi:hypothetical protein